MVPHDTADEGSTAQGFPTTQWRLIVAAQKRADPDLATIGSLLELYWRPVYCYLRRSGCDQPQAEDLTQGFFHEVVLGRRLIQKADPSKGRFRAFLLHALQQYVTDTRRKDARRPQIPREKLVSLEAAPWSALPPAVATASPEECFLYAWKAALLDQTLAAVEAECLSSGQQVHWQLFRDHLVRPTLEGREPPSLHKLCQRYGVASEKTGSNMIITVKRRFQRTLRKLLRGTAGSDTQADEDWQDIF